jgi:hypothetical protein
MKTSRNEEKEKMERQFAGIKRKHDEIDDKVEQTKVRSEWQVLRRHRFTAPPPREKILK